MWAIWATPLLVIAVVRSPFSSALISRRVKASRALSVEYMTSWTVRGHSASSVLARAETSTLERLLPVSKVMARRSAS
eukprot:2396593-Rhodomonas_salina.2